MAKFIYSVKSRRIKVGDKTYESIKQAAGLLNTSASHLRNLAIKKRKFKDMEVILIDEKPIFMNSFKKM